MASQKRTSAYSITTPTRTGANNASRPLHDDTDVRRCQDALFDALRDDTRSMLSTSMIPANIAQPMGLEVDGPSWLLVGGRNALLDPVAHVFEFALGGAEQAWVTRSPMTEPRTGHAATLSVAGAPLVIDGYSDDRVRAVYEFMPQNNAWRSVAELPENRVGHAATTVGRDVFVCGGWTPRDDYSSDVRVLRAGEAAWALTTPMPIGIDRHACAALSDAASPGFVVAGGETSEQRASAQSHRYSFMSGRWSLLSGKTSEHRASAQSHRYDCASDRWTLLGGNTSEHQASARSHRYDCTSDRWTRLGDITSARHSLRAETHGDGAVHVCGGCEIDITERLDVRAGTWQVVAPLPATVSYHAVCLFDATTMVSLGGYVNGPFSRRCFAYDTRADRWREESRWQLPSALCGHTVTRF